MSGQNNLVGWSSDLESGGRRFDSRLPEGRFGVTFSSMLGCLGMCLGVVWGRFRMGLGWFWKKCPTGSENHFFLKLAGSIFPESGRFRIAFLTYPRSTNVKKKNQFYRKFPYILFGVFAGVIVCMRVCVCVLRSLSLEVQGTGGSRPWHLSDGAP